MTLFRPAIAACAVVALGFSSLFADGPYRSRDNKNPNDVDEGTYPFPYQLPTQAEITEILTRIHGFMEKNAPTQIIDRETGAPITDLSKPNKNAVTHRGKQQFYPLAYEMGVVHSGMLKAATVTGDARFKSYTDRHFNFLRDKLPYFRDQEAAFKLGRANSFRAILEPLALDDSGAMLASVIRAKLDGVGPDMKHFIDTWSTYISKQQFRLADGTMARQRPQAESLWADDYYMSVPALAEMGRLTGDRAWFDDAVKTVDGMWKRLYNPARGVLTHGWNANNPDAPQFYWARANGWAVLAVSDLLDVMPTDHPAYERVLGYHRALLKGLAQYQSGAGLWHQLLDRPDSYLETSATAMFVYGYAHAINRGWISPTTYGSIAQAGWCALVLKVTPEGGVDGTCVGTTFASDAAYYYSRPANQWALHGYGPVLLAGAEMIELLRNPKIDIQYKLRTYHYVPKDGGKTDYREHAAP